MFRASSLGPPRCTQAAFSYDAFIPFHFSASYGTVTLIRYFIRISLTVPKNGLFLLIFGESEDFMDMHVARMKTQREG